MSVPSPWSALILAAAAYRIWRMLAEDTVFDGPRHWLVGLPWGWQEGDAIPQKYRVALAEFLTCPWCLGFWISLGVWGLWQVDTFKATVALTPFAISTAVGITRTKLDPPD